MILAIVIMTLRSKVVFFVFQVIDDIKDRLIKAFYELSDIFADVVVEPYYFHYRIGHIGSTGLRSGE